jgi:CubicO group peptidase (beta-lactamase class C family)
MQVARKSWLYAKGMQDAGVLATAKHFPGHGDTDADSHQDLPVISQTRQQLDSLELFPFEYLIKNGIAAVMTGHLQVPVLEPNGKIPATLSRQIISGKLRKDLGFEGLIITDAMNMKGVANLYSSAESAVKALKAGNDMIEIIPRLDRAIAAVKLAVKNGEISAEEIDEKCRKILAAKYWLGLAKKSEVEIRNLGSELQKSEYHLTKRLLHEKSMTVLINEQNVIPLQRLDTLKIASLIIGSSEITPFQQMLDNFTNIDHFQCEKLPTEAEINSLLNQLKPYNLILVGLNGMGMFPGRRFGITDQQIEIVKRLEGKNTIYSFFGNPYALAHFPSITKTKGLILAYQDTPEAQEMAAQLIFGAIGANGKLPVTIPDLFSAESGLKVQPVKRLKYTIPEEENINSNFLTAKIDSLAEHGITNKAFPGCQVLIAKNGKVIFQKSYGYFTYEDTTAVQNNHLLDLASVTKIAASMPVIMKLYDDKKINLDAPLSTYLKEFKNTNKSELTLRDILTHQARLQSGIPFWFESGSYTKLREGVFRTQPSEKYSTRVSSGLYTHSDFRDQMIADIAKSPLRTTKEFHYSDLGFSLFPEITKRITGVSFHDFLNQEFYSQLGTGTLLFRPFEHFPIEQILPTENDQIFRKELLQGFVHDETAALMGGISGNAGLFSTANDLAKLMQLFLQNGFYGGKQYIDSTTVRLFTKTQFPNSENRRALGFDKPLKGPNGKNKFPAADASQLSFGHTGFTGTFVWADPENQTLFIFLSNRVYPTRRNSAINTLNIRTEMHQAIYDAIKKGYR